MRINRLTARQVETAKLSADQDRRMLADGGNLYLQITRKAGGGFNRSWIFRYEVDGRRRDLGLGPLDTFSLSEARDKARALRQQIHGGVDPLAAREQERATQKAGRARALTFRECAMRYIEAHEASWRNAEHRRQWSTTLQSYCYPVLGDLSVAAIDTGLVLQVIEPLWKDRTETASRVRGRIETVLDWAKARGYRDGENPARWRGHLDHLLPARSKAQRAKHHAALPYVDMPAFMIELRGRDGLSALALEFCILTATRTGEALGATWDEIDFATKTWTVPAERMKSGKAHKVPLSDRALEILRSLPRTDARVFPPYAKAMLRLLKELRSDITVHGFRSSFRDWSAERTNFPREVCEMALAHKVGTDVERSYRRTDLFDHRRRLMGAWAAWCSRPVPTGATVTAFARESK
jgi:integrase